MGRRLPHHHNEFGLGALGELVELGHEAVGVHGAQLDGNVLVRCVAVVVVRQDAILLLLILVLDIQSLP